MDELINLYLRGPKCPDCKRGILSHRSGDLESWNPRRGKEVLHMEYDFCSNVKCDYENRVYNGVR